MRQKDNTRQIHLKLKFDINCVKVFESNRDWLKKMGCNSPTGNKSASCVLVKSSPR